MDDLRRVLRELLSPGSHSASRCDANLLRAEFSDYSNRNPIVHQQQNHFQCVGRRLESGFADTGTALCVCVCVMRRRCCNKAQSVTTRVSLDTSRRFYIPTCTSFTPQMEFNTAAAKCLCMKKELKGLRSICAAFSVHLVFVGDLAGLLQHRKNFFN